jgi:hypothetical protein
LHNKPEYPDEQWSAHQVIIVYIYVSIFFIN